MKVAASAGNFTGSKGADQLMDAKLKAFPEVERVFGKLGRADTATDPALAQIEEAFSVEAVTKEFFAKYAQLIGPITVDSDGDGVPDDVDLCPAANATGFDVNGDGCIDSTSGLGTIIGTLVQEGVIAPELQTSLMAKVENAEKSATKENICAAVNQLGALKNQVNAQRGNKISDEAADEITEYTDSVIAHLLSLLPEGESCY